MNEQIVNTLFSMQDLEYQAFQIKLMPTVSADCVIGVRTPMLRTYAKKIRNTSETEVFLHTLPHRYYEENNLHAFLIEQIQDFDVCISELNRFLPYVDNWATCDMMRPKCFKKNPKELLREVEKWLNSSHAYTIRFGIEVLMIFYLDEQFDMRFLNRVAKIRSEEYYVNMMIAWYFATALAKQYESAVKVLEEKHLSVWVQNKTIQKAVESYRITAKQKLYLRSLKI